MTTKRKALIILNIVVIAAFPIMDLMGFKFSTRALSFQLVFSGVFAFVMWKPL
jgi:hypothetical protein